MDHYAESIIFNRSEFGNEKILDEARYNLATHIMSNGVELIIASDNKIKYVETTATIPKLSSNLSQQPKPLLITQTHHKPLTLSPSTLKNQMMILTLPSNFQNKLIIPDNDNSFVTKICLTTYTYRTTFVKNGSTLVESKKMVITNSLTEEKKYSHLISDVTFSKTPELIVGMFPTTYHFYNTFDKDKKSLPFVITSKYTITNTITGPDLRLSEALIPAYYTNTYFSRILLTRTLYDEELKKPTTTVTNENYLTQVIITETPFLPAKNHQVIRPTSIISNEGYNELHESFSTTHIIKNIFIDSEVDPLIQPDYLLALSSKQNSNESPSIANPFSNLNKSKEYLKTKINTLNTAPVLSLKLPKDIEKSHGFSSQPTQLSKNIIKHNNQYNTEIRPSKLYTNFLNSHTKSISALNLERFRPILTIVAQLLKKQLINTSTGETNIREKHNKASLTNTNQMISENTLYYIPLKQTRQNKSEVGQQYLNVTNKRRKNMNKFRINTLLVEPLKLYTKEPPKLSVSRQHIFETSSDITYENGFLNTGIPIRPGEVITASADVIFGRQTNLNDRISYTQIYSGYYSTLSNHFLTTLMPSIPFMELRSKTIRNDMILKPPPIPLHKQQHLLSISSYDFIQLGRSPEQIRFSPIDQSIDQNKSLKLNSAFYSNQILNIFRQPQIFSTRIQDTSSYETFYFTPSAFNNDQVTLKPTLSTLLQQVNLRNDVLSHTINMHAQPITFKRETENIALTTSIRGHHIKRFETPFLALKNYEVTKSKDLAFKGSALKYETKISNLRGSESIKKETDLTKNTSNFDIKKEFPSLHISKQENPEIVQENYNERSTEYDQNADSSHDSLQVVNSISKKRNEFLVNKPILNNWISIATNFSKRTLTKSKFSTISIINSSYNQPKSRLSSQYAEYAVGNFMIIPEKHIPYKANPELIHFTRLSPMNEIQSLNLTSNKEIELQTSLVETLDNSQNYLRVIPVTNAALLSQTKELFIWNPQIMSSVKKSNIFITLKTSLKKTFEILEPSENLRDDIYTLSKKTSLNLLVTTKAHSTIKSINYYNILKPTKTQSTYNTLIIKPTTTNSIVTNTTKAFKNNNLNTDYKYNNIKYSNTNNYNNSNNNNNNKISNNNKNMKNNYNTNTKNDNIEVSPIQILRDTKAYFRGMDSTQKDKILSKNFTLNDSEIITSAYKSQKPVFIKEISTINGIIRYNKSSSTNLDITEVENIETFTTKINVKKIDWRSPLKYSNNFTNAKANLKAFVINYPPKVANYLKMNFDNDCQPSCKSNKNEICVAITNNASNSEESHCVCRPSFGRMFPDRPCKPTYTYEMQMQANYGSNHYLRFNDILKSNTILLEAADRMLMQSDLRDIYHNVQLKAVISTEQNDTLIAQFILQLSENTNENQLKTIFRKYLRQSNFSIGNTGLYSSKNGLELLDIKDFDECISDNFNDCSINAYCFNLIGSYTCSCKNGHIDESDNALYPGRICSDNTIGCDKCNYHGKCIITEKKNVECKCLTWYAGTKCQVNLKIMTIFIIIGGTILAIFLLFYFLLINTNRKRNETFIRANTLHSSMITSTESHINDTISQSSHGSSLSLKKCHGAKAIPIRNMYDILNIKKAVDNPVISIHNHDKSLQTDHSIALMIPRAKYCWPYISSQSQHHHRFNNNQDNNRSLPDMTWKSVIQKHDLNINPCRPHGNFSKKSIDIGKLPNIEATLVSAGSAEANASNILMSKDIEFAEAMEINDANAMTERDLGSTFLLPHTHLYKPDQTQCNFSDVEFST